MVMQWVQAKANKR